MGRWTVLLFTMMLLFYFNTATRAETKSSEKPVTKINTVVVTATKTEDKIEDIPASVSVVWGCDIEESGARVVQDALHQIPGIMLNDVSGNGTLTMMTMRGMPSTNSQYVLVLVDGVPQNTPSDTVRWAAIPMENVERIEVVRGPASALYGMNAIGGVINIITKKGTHKKEFVVSAGYGSYEENKEKVYVAGKAGIAGISFGAVRHASDGWRKKNNQYEQYNIFGKFSCDFSPVSTLSLNLAYSEWDHEWPESILIEDYREGRREGGINDNGSEKNKETDPAIIFEHRFNDRLAVTNRLYGQWVENEWRAVVDVIDEDLESSRIGNDLRLEMDHPVFGLKNKVVAGYHFENQDLEVIRRFSEFFPVQSLVGNTMLDNEAIRQIHSGYIQDMFYIGDKIILTAGLRYDCVEFDYDNNLDPSLSGTDTMDHWSPKAGLTFKPIENLSFFANAGTGFKTPTASQVAHYSGLAPETAVSYEAGVKGTLADRLIFSMSWYHTNLDDQLTSVADSNEATGFRITNAGESEMKGFEMELNFQLNEGLSLFTSYHYNHSEFTDFVDEEMGFDYSGNRLAWQPEHKLVGGVRYEHPLGIKAVLVTKWLDEQFISDANEFSQESYSLTDIEISYSRKNWEVSMAVRNLFDEDYTAYGENWGDGFAFLTVGDPATFFGQVTYTF